MPKPLSSTPPSQVQYQLPRGIHVPDLSGIHEAYDEVQSDHGYWTFRINVSAENIPRVFQRLAREVGTPGFVVMEVGTQRDEEAKLRKLATDPFHKDVYYLDGLSTAQALSLFDTYSDLLVHDGGVNVGFGSHHGKDEVFIGAYKIFEIYADHPEKYRAALSELGVKREEKLRTVWNTFTPQMGGQRGRVEGSTKTVWDMVNELKVKGLYFAERRED